jgi:hypothetical protein
MEELALELKTNYPKIFIYKPNFFNGKCHKNQKLYKYIQMPYKIIF